jgi:hypothetical protein
VYNLLANPVHSDSGDGAQDGSQGGSKGLTLQVDAEPRFIEFEGSADEFASRLKQASYEGSKPVKSEVYDITGRIDGSGNAALPVGLTNTGAESRQVTVSVQAEGLSFEASSRQVTLPPAGETKRVKFMIGSGETSPGNAYPVQVEVNTSKRGTGGSATLEETVHQAVIARGSPSIDGQIEEWSKFNAVPVRMRQGEGSENEMEEQRLKRPWKEFAEENDAFAAEMAYAADEKNLYVMARVQDAKKQLIPSMLSGENLHKKQNKPAEYIYIEKGPTQGAAGDLIQLALGGLNQDAYQPKYELRPPEHPLHRFGSYIATPYKYFIYPTADGGAEVFRVRTPEFYYLHPLPFDYEWTAQHCRVKGAEVKVRRTDSGYVYEAALPWSELKGVPHQPGDRIRLSMAVQDSGPGNRLVWSKNRSTASLTRLSFEPGYGDRWSAETQWTFAAPSEAADQ